MGGRRRARGNRRRSSSSSSSYSGNPFVIRSSGGGGSSQQNNQTGQNNQNTGRKVYRDTKAEEERNEGSYLDTVIPGTNETHREKRNREANAAYLASQQRQEDMQRAINLQKVTGGNLNPDTGGLTDEELEFMRNTGLFAMEASGAMDNFGLEVEANRLKKIINEGGAGYKEALAELTRLSGGNEELAKINALGIQEYINRKTKGDPKAMTDIISGKTKIEGLSPDFFKNFTSQTGNVAIDRDKLGTFIGGDALGYDKFGTTSFNDADAQFRSDFYTLQDKNAPIDAAYKNLLKSRLGYSSSPYGFGGGGGGGYGYGYGGGSGGGGGYGLNMGMGMQGQPRQRAQVGPGDLQERVNQSFLSGGRPFAKGGIVSLVED